MEGHGGRALLAIDGLTVSIATPEGRAQVLDQVDLRLSPGRIVGVVGESGCGKTTLVRTILGVLPGGARLDAGRVLLDGEDLLGVGQGDLSRRIRSRVVGFVPQDPYLALNPVFTVGAQLREILRWHAAPEDGGPRGPRARHHARLLELLRALRIPDAEGALQRYPHEFSGGQRQRLLIAGALACRPRLIVADEPTSALDVTTQQDILALLKEITRTLAVSVVLVTHDLGVVAQWCDEVVVMYAGQTVEAGPAGAVVTGPRHPYTEMLIACHPDRARELAGIPGTVASPLDPPSGCRFHPRCPWAAPACAVARPPVTLLAPGHQVRCVRYSGNPGGPPEAASG